MARASSFEVATDPAWAVLGPLPSISDRGIDPGAQELALGPALGAGEGQGVDVAGVAHRGDAQRQQHRAGKSRRQMHVRVPQSGDQGLAGAVDDLGARGRRKAGGGADAGDEALVDHHRLVGAKWSPPTKARTWVKATGPAGVLTSALARAGERLASASSWAF